MEYKYTPPPPDLIEYRMVSKVLKTDINFRKNAVKQFDIPAYYQANIRHKDKPIFSQVRL